MGLEAIPGDRNQQVLLDGEISSQLPVVRGVPQGSVLGSLLFLTFINDLPEWVASKTRLFADDCILYRTIHTQQDRDILQQDLHHLELWELTWGMEFHPWKCNSMSITRSRTSIENRYSLKGHIFENVKEAKYLGVTLSSNLTWNTQICNITGKANKLLGFLRRNLKVRNETTKENAYKAIDSKIKFRILLYSMVATYQKEQRWIGKSTEEGSTLCIWSIP